MSVVSCIKINPFSKIEEVKKIWVGLHNKCSQSFFLSWPWIETWLKTLPKSEKLFFVYAVKDNKPFVAYFICLRKNLKHKIIYANRGYLNSIGEPELDEITIEYNGILLDKEYTKIPLSVLQLGNDSPWDELVCPAVDSRFLDILCHENNDLDVIIERTSPSYLVKLETVRELNNDLLPLLSKNKRSQIRQSIRRYESKSEEKLKVEVAKNVSEALIIFENLEHLHQERWGQKNQSGCFASDYFRIFHTKFITNYFSNVHMLTISYDKQIVGYIYNFVYQNTVLFYQSGFNYVNNNQYRPGLVSHYLAINYYAEQGFDTYDFLAGDSGYKKSLSTGFNELHWIRIRKKQFKFKVEDAMRKLKFKITRQK